jgi:hypothetical protein
MSKKLCEYYVGKVERKRAWLLSAVMRGTEHVAFDRTIDKVASTFEFFVPKDTEAIFLQAMDYLKNEGVLLSLEKQDNRILTESM